jgi:hypothetical protein
VNQVGAQAPTLIGEADFTYADTNSIFVSDSTGNDSTGDGTQAKPYKTIKKGIDSTTSAKGYVIVLDSATYSESDLNAATYTYFLGLYAATSGAPYLSQRTLDYTPSNSNSIFVDKDGDDGDAGTQAAPKLTIAGAIAACDGTHQNIVIMDSGTYEETGFELTGNAKNIYAALGQNPTIEMTSNVNFFSIAEEKAETSFYAADMSEIASVVLGNGNVFLAYNVYPGGIVGKGYFTVLNSSDWSTEQSETLFHDAITTSIAVSVLDDGNIIIAYVDNDDSNKGKYLVLSSSDWSTVKSETVFHDASTGSIAVSVLADGNIFISYVDLADGSKGKYLVLNSSWIVVKSETVFHDAATNYVAVSILADENIFIAYRDTDDSNKGKYLVLSSSDWSTVKSETVFHNASTGSIAVSVLADGNVFITYKDGVDNKGKYLVLSSSDWSTVKSETVFHDSDTYETTVSVLSDGNVFIAYTDSVYYGKFLVFEPLLHHIVNSVASKLHGLTLTSKDGNKYYLNKFISSTANIDAKWCTFEGNESDTDGQICKTIYSDSDVNLYNCIFRDNDAGIYTQEDESIIEECQFYRNNRGYAIDIDGAAASSGNIRIEHNDIFNNYGSVHLENNNGANEIIKNNNLYDNDNGIDAETAVTISYSVCTDDNTNVTDGASVVNANPLYLNEGASDPDDTDLNVKVRTVGDFADSPAKDLADDSRNSGSIDVKYIGEETTWTEITVPKPDKFGPPYLKFNATAIVKNDGSVSSQKKAQTEYLPIKWGGIENTYAEDILDMWLAESSQVRIYPDPVTYPNDYDLFNKIWDSNMNEGASFWPLSRTGVSEISLMFARGYE